MRQFIKSLLNLYIYSSVHIGLAAGSLVYLSYIAFELTVDYDYLYYVFFATVLLYNVHRIVGIKKLAQENYQGRFAVISRYRNHIFIYAIIAGFCSVWFFFKLEKSTWIQLGIPAVISTLYSLPLLGNQRRLRDFNYIKIFLVAITWAVVTLAIPLNNYNENGAIIFMLCLERASFIFAITLPFDWRDEDIDTLTGVKTMVHVLGKNKSLALSMILFILNAAILLFLFVEGRLSFLYLSTLCISYIITALVILRFRNSKSDYIYSGLIDGSMALPLIVYLTLQACL